MYQTSKKVGILLTGRNTDLDFIQQIIDMINKEYSHIIEFVPSGKESLQLDITEMSPLKSNLEEEVEWIVQVAIGVKKYERVRNRTIKKAIIEAQIKAGTNHRKSVN